MQQPRRVQSLVKWLAGCVIATGFVAGVVLPAPALAHADLVDTNPPDGAILTEPVVLVELTFSEGVGPSGQGFRLLNPDGLPVAATVFQPDPTQVIIEPDSPLESGSFVVIWQAQSADAHVLSGSFSFAIDGPPSESTEAGSIGIAPKDDVPETSTTAPTPPMATTLPERAQTAPATVEDVVRAAPDFETEQETSALTGRIGDLGRWATMVGALLAVGAFVFAATTLLGTPDEVRRSARWIRRGSILVIVGTTLEVLAVAIATSVTPGGAFSATHIMDSVGIQFGIAVILRFVGAIAMLQDPRSLVVSRGRPVLDARRTQGPAVESSSTGDRTDGTTIVETVQQYRVEIQHEWVMIAGMVAVVASFALDGHSVDTGLIARIASMAHVVAGGVWFGGLVVMSDTLIRRRKAAVGSDAAFMAVRFSRVAAASLILAAVAGVVLTWTFVDAPSEIVTTSWGRLLILKVALVGVAAAIGAYNHFRVVPRISNDSGDQKAAVLRRTTRIESAILVGVLGVTALLVAAVV